MALIPGKYTKQIIIVNTSIPSLHNCTEMVYYSEQKDPYCQSSATKKHSAINSRTTGYVYIPTLQVKCIGTLYNVVGTGSLYKDPTGLG